MAKNAKRKPKRGSQNLPPIIPQTQSIVEVVPQAARRRPHGNRRTAAKRVEPSRTEVDWSNHWFRIVASEWLPTKVVKTIEREVEHILHQHETPVATNSNNNDNQQHF